LVEERHSGTLLVEVAPAEERLMKLYRRLPGSTDFVSSPHIQVGSFTVTARSLPTNWLSRQRLVMTPRGAGAPDQLET